MIAFLVGSKIGRMIGGAFAMIAFLATAIFAIRRDAVKDERTKEVIETHERINKAEISTDSKSAREWLRKRK